MDTRATLHVDSLLAAFGKCRPKSLALDNTQNGKHRTQYGYASFF